MCRTAELMTPECETLGLVAYAIEMNAEVEALRLIRNACRDGFSYDNEEISPQAQAAWWVVMRGRVKGWLYSHLGHLVGYGLLRQSEDGRWWSSVAILPEQAGNGFGGAVTADLVRRSDEPTWGIARIDNPKGQRLHRAADWEEVERDERLVTYRTLPHVYMAAATAEWARSGWVLT